MLPRATIMATAALAALAATGAGGQEPEAKPRLDGRGDPLPAGAVARLGTMRWGIGEYPLRFTSDGRRAIACGQRPWLIDAVTGRILRDFPGARAGAFLLPDDRTLVASADNSVVLLDIDTGKELRRWPIDVAPGAFSADGKRMVSLKFDAKFRPTITVWDLTSGKALQSWERRAVGMALSPDGTTLALCDYQEITILDSTSGAERLRWKSPLPNAGHTTNSRLIEFSPDGTILASSAPAGVALWDPKTGRAAGAVKSPLLQASAPGTVAFSRDGRLLAAGTANKGLFVWEVKTGKLLHTMSDAGAGLPIYVVNFTPDARTLISQAHLFHHARLWDLDTGKEVSPPDTHAARIDAIGFSADGNEVATLGPGDPVAVWDAASGKRLRRFATPTYMGINFGGAVAFLPGGRSLAMTLPGRPWVLDLGTGTVLSKPPDPDNAPSDVFANCAIDAHTLLAVFPGEVKRIVDNGGRMPRMEIRWAKIGLWDVRTRKIVRSFRVDAEQIRSLCVSPDRRMLAGVPDQHKHAVIWDLATGVEMCRIPLPMMLGPSPRFSADGRTLFVSSWQPVAGDAKLIVTAYEVASGKKRVAFEHRRKEATRATHAIFSDRLMAITSNEQVCLVDPFTGKEYRRYEGDNGPISCLAFSPDGNRLATGTEGTTALVWDIAGAVPPVPAIRLSEEQLAAAWKELAGDDAEAAYRAIQRLSQAPEQTVAWVGQRLAPVPGVPAARIERLLVGLDNDSFDERNAAADELLKLGEAAEDAMAAHLKKPVSLEARRRTETLLATIRKTRLEGPWTVTGTPLRDVRAVETLERIGGRVVVPLLERLATGAADAPLTRYVRATLERVNKGPQLR
jgi:WD40 repeat protein